jgi:nicotinamide-nucleotide amidase
MRACAVDQPCDAEVFLMSAWSELKPLMLGPPTLTLSAAESLTCGQVQARIGSISGASTFFLGGITAYALEQKVHLLAVNRDAARAANSVSEEIARQMARGACALFGSDLAVATTGYAESPPTTGGDPYSWWALAHRAEPGDWRERSGRVVVSGDHSREAVQHLIADEVLRQLSRYMREWRG